MADLMAVQWVELMGIVRVVVKAVMMGPVLVEL